MNCYSNVKKRSVLYYTSLFLFFVQYNIHILLESIFAVTACQSSVAEM